jgi:hypothetical protein
MLSRRDISISRAVPLLLIALGAFSIVATPVIGQPAASLSFGCNFLNSPFLDGVYPNDGISTSSFFAGETVTVTAGQPVVFNGGTLTGITLQFNDISLGLTTLWNGISPPQASLAHTFTSDTTTNVSWGLFQSVTDTATWTVSCTHTVGGVVGSPNCHGTTAAALNTTYGSLCAAAAALGFVNTGGACDVAALQVAISAYCHH